MGTLADSMFSVLMSWVRALVSAIWALFGSDRTTALEFLGKNWLGIAALMIVIGLVVDWLVWLLRWRPYHIWAKRARRLLRMEEPEDMQEEPAYAYPPDELDEPQAVNAEQESWMPLAPPQIGEEEAQQVMDAAGQVSDESLGQYPGMRYDSRASMQDAQADKGDTRRLAAVHAEGPGAAEVSRRRAEIDAWQRQMQEEARRKAQAEREAREAELARARAEREAQEAYEAEQARLAKEAYEAEQERLAQEEYARQLEEYERQKAQYERDMAEYERQKAEYEAAVAAQQAAQNTEFAQENPQPAVNGGARRRRRAASYSDYVDGETVEELPAPPQWHTVQSAAPAQRPPDAEAAHKPERKGILRGGMDRMAQMLEPEHEDVTGITDLPPRIDRHDAYKPAKRPDQN